MSDEKLQLFWKAHCSGGVPASTYLMKLDEEIFKNRIGYDNAIQWQKFIIQKSKVANSEWDIGQLISAAWFCPTSEIIEIIEEKLVGIGLDMSADVSQLKYRQKIMLSSPEAGSDE